MPKIGSPFQPAVPDICPPTDRPGDLKRNVATLEICSTRYRQQQQQWLAIAAAQSTEAVVQKLHAKRVDEGIVGLPAPTDFFRSRGVCAENGRFARLTSARDYNNS